MKTLTMLIMILGLTACGKSNDFKNQIKQSNDEVAVQEPSLDLCNQISKNIKGDYMIKNSNDLIVVSKGLVYFWGKDGSISTSADGKLSLGNYCDLNIINGSIDSVIEKQLDPQPTAPNCGGWFNPCPTQNPPQYGSCGPYPCY